MTMAQVQPLNIPTASELAKAHDFLCESAILVADVKSLLSDSSNFAMVARLTLKKKGFEAVAERMEPFARRQRRTVDQRLFIKIKFGVMMVIV